MDAHLSAFPALVSSAIDLGVDLTFVAHFVLFATFVEVMRPLLFQPLLRLYQERERRTEGARERARELDADAGRLMARIDAEVAKARLEAGLEREKQRRQVARLEAEIMEDARNQTTEILSAGQVRIAAELDELRRELAAEKPYLAAQIASKILGREVQS
jgi:F-type H+-transporting ATPase subunit b